MSRRRILATLTFLGFLLTACSAAASPQVENPGQNGEKTNVGAGLPADIEITVYQGEGFQEGQTIAFSDLFSAGKPVVLNFWAGLCPPCRLEMPDLQEVYEEYQDQILLFGLDVGPFTALGTREDGQALIQTLGVTYPAGTTFDAEVVRSYQILGMPTTFFITPDGEVFEKWTGILTNEKMGELVEELLAASAYSP